VTGRRPRTLQRSRPTITRRDGRPLLPVVPLEERPPISCQACPSRVLSLSARTLCVPARTDSCGEANPSLIMARRGEAACLVVPHQPTKARRACRACWTMRVGTGHPQDGRRRVRNGLARVVRVETRSRAIPLDEAASARAHASFVTLVPMLRPGGLYIVEDWRWSYNDEPPPSFENVQPVAKLVSEAIDAVARGGESVRSVTALHEFAAIEKAGPRWRSGYHPYGATCSGAFSRRCPPKNSVRSFCGGTELGTRRWSPHSPTPDFVRASS
jgi:hypothetical protein